MSNLLELLKAIKIFFFLILGLSFLTGCWLNKNSVQPYEVISEVVETEIENIKREDLMNYKNEDDPSVSEETNGRGEETNGRGEEEIKVKESEINEQKFELPETYDQKVAFAPQAPFAVWDELHEEACEEAAMIIAAKHLKGEKLDKKIMEEEINRLIDWENKNLGKWKDTTAKETAKIIQDYFHLTAGLLPTPKTEAIKKELVNGNLIIAPTAGRMLDNPYFSGEGPLYHMLVIRGYDQTHFITNDPGTKRGEGFKYTYMNLLGSIHDWNNGEVRKGERVVIVVGK